MTMDKITLANDLLKELNRYQGLLSELDRLYGLCNERGILNTKYKSTTLNFESSGVLGFKKDYLTLPLDIVNIDLQFTKFALEKRIIAIEEKVDKL
jgi:hypothetical protein